MNTQRRSARTKAELTPEELERRDRKRQRGARKLRVGILGLLLAVGAGCVVKRAYEIQVKSPQSYERRYRQEIEVQARRASLLARDGKVAQADVKVGVRRDGVAEVTEGLQVGDRIVVEGTGKLRAGASVQDATAAKTPG